MLFTSRGAVAQLSCNDLRMRGSLPLQIGLAVFAGLGVVWLWDRTSRLVRVGLVAVIALGVASTVWTFTERGLVRFVQPPAVTAEALAAYEFIRGHTPADAIFQGDVGREVHQDRLLHLYADRVSRVESGSYPLLQVPADIFRPDVQNVVAAFRTRDGEEAWRLWTRSAWTTSSSGRRNDRPMALIYPSSTMAGTSRWFMTTSLTRSCGLGETCPNGTEPVVEMYGSNLVKLEFQDRLNRLGQVGNYSHGFVALQSAASPAVPGLARCAP